MTLAQAAVEGITPSGLLSGKLVARQSQVTTGPVFDKARSATCSVAVSDRVRAYCLGRLGRFGGRIYCFKHQRTVRPGLPLARSGRPPSSGSLPSLQSEDGLSDPSEAWRVET